jgi:hypothetical protein
MKIYLATWLLEKGQGKVLTKKNYMNRLLSYYHTQQKPGRDFIRYIKHGR